MLPLHSSSLPLKTITLEVASSSSLSKFNCFRFRDPL